jgi:antitoxin FitA
MVTMVIRNVDAELYSPLMAIARGNGRSMEAEAHARLRECPAAESPAPGQTLGEAVRAVFGPLGGVEFELPDRRDLWSMIPRILLVPNGTETSSLE